jgi:epoxyqueuosine reductase
MEKPLAQAAGIGWIGKHTNLVSRNHGSWTVSGLDLHHGGAGGGCRRSRSLRLLPGLSFDACPTDAFPAPYQIDARRCISYLTIENKGPIPHEFRTRHGQSRSMAAMIALQPVPGTSTRRRRAR